MLGDVHGPSIVSDDHSNAGKGFLKMGQQVGYPVANADVGGGRRISKPKRNDDCGRDCHCESDHREQRVVYEHQRGDDDQGECLHQEVDDAILKENGQSLDVGRHPSEQHARLFVRVVVDALSLHVAENSNTKRLVEAFPESPGEGHADGTHHC